jgi:subtilisin family serine protease
MLRQVRRAVSALSVATVLATLLVASNLAGATTGGSVAAAAGTTGPSRSVTLITGDVVRWGVGGEPTVTPRATNGSLRASATGAVSYHVYQHDGDWYVVPTDAATLIGSGLVDQRLFDVSELARQGLDDAGTQVVPLLFQYADTATTRNARQPHGAKVRRALPEIGLIANDESKTATARFWKEFVGGASPVARTGAGGVRRVWLNNRYHASLEQSVPQIGAPTAWRAGYTGKGITVAVLDTGYDGNHPDLAGQVATAKNFTNTDGLQDRVGHGTHVASIVAGAGVASMNRRRGVAPESKLAVGKVLDDSGGGFEDAIIAGMDWAVIEAGAKVVNMSLGGAQGDGTSLLEQEVNRLSNDYGALFVIAAGNDGAQSRVTTPASADTALAVSSVDKSDRLSDFASQGPRYRDGLAKPELAAPGEGIMAARAAGTFPDSAGDPYYVPLSGTSMASPHVAGAAALLAQQHPDWRGDRLKAALVDSATPVNGAGVFAVGAGRIDVARAVTQNVTASVATVSTHLPWSDREKRVESTFTYRNDSASPAILALSLTMADRAGNAAPAGLAAPGVPTVTVPAHGSASVSVQVSGHGAAAGSYGGVLVAVGDGAVVRTPVVVQLDAETHNLDVRVLDRDGQPTRVPVLVIRLDSAEGHLLFPGQTLSLPTGRYAIVTAIRTDRPGQNPMYVNLANPQIHLTADTSVDLDARWARPVPLSVTDQPAARTGARTVRIGAHAVGATHGYAVVSLLDPSADVYAGSAPGLSADEFRFANLASLQRPELELSAETPERFAVPAVWLSNAVTPPFTGIARLRTVAVALTPSGELNPDDLARVRGNLAVLNGQEGVSLASVAQALQRAGASMVALADNRFIWAGEQLALPTMWMNGANAARFAQAARSSEQHATVTGNPVSPYRYSLAFVQRGSIPERLELRASTATLAAVQTSYHSNTDEWRGVFDSVTVRGEQWQPLMAVPVPAPLARVEYYTPGAWQLNQTTAAAVTQNLEAGPNPPLAWSKAVLGPGLTGPTDRIGGRPWVARTRDVIDVTLPLYTDAAGHPQLPGDEFGTVVTGSTSLYRGGKLIGTINRPGWGTFSVPPGQSNYRLTAEAIHDTLLWPLSTKVTAAWSFRSATGSTATPLPLITVGFDAPVTVHNAVAMGSREPIRVTVHRQPGVAEHRITTLTVDASYDDGVTWQSVPVHGQGNQWLAYPPTAAAGYLSLRSHATDTGGNTVELTVIRAYQITS